MRRNTISTVTFFLILSILLPIFTCTASAESTGTKKKIALTFDDGPHPRYTDEILDILSEYNIKATFFVIGINAEYYPKQLKREVREGHEIGNHTYSHPHMKSLDAAATREQILKCQKVITDLTGKPPKLFRPPEGFCTTCTSTVMKECGFTPVLWNIDTRDWAGTSVDAIVNNVKNGAGSGKIILFHDYVSCKNSTIPALRILIPYLLKQGYEFCTVSELYESMHG